MAVSIVVLLLLPLAVQAQFKSQREAEEHVSNGLADGSGQSPVLFGWFNPDNFHMRHIFSMSYTTFSGQGISLGTYTNSMTYDFARNLNARADVSMMYSPYNSFSSSMNGGKGKNNFSSIFLSRAEVNYRPWDNTLLQVQYRQVPFGGPYSYSPFASPWWGESGF